MKEMRNISFKGVLGVGESKSVKYQGCASLLVKGSLAIKLFA